MRSILWKSWDGWEPWGRSYSGLTGFDEAVCRFWSGAGILGDKIAEMVREYVMEHYKERITPGTGSRER